MSLFLMIMFSAIALMSLLIFAIPLLAITGMLIWLLTEEYPRVEG